MYVYVGYCYQGILLTIMTYELFTISGTIVLCGFLTNRAKHS